MPAGYHATLISAQGDGSALANSTTPTSILPGQAKWTMGAGFLFAPGQVLTVLAHGRISNIVTSPGTILFELKFGSTTVASSGTMSLNTTAKTNVPWRLDWELTCRAVGASTTATLMHQSKWTSESVVGSSSGTALSIFGPSSAPAVGSGFDSTSAQLVDLVVTWSVANSGNSITLHQFRLDSLGP